MQLGDKLTNNPALIAIHRSRSGDVLLDDVEVDRRQRDVAISRRVPDPEQDLPREKVWEERRRRRRDRVPREEAPHIAPERPASGLDDRRGEREKVVEIIDGVVRPLHPLERARVHDHEGGVLSDRVGSRLCESQEAGRSAIDLRERVGFGLTVLKGRRRRRKGREIKVVSYGGGFLGFSGFGADRLRLHRHILISIIFILSENFKKLIN